MGHDVVSRLFQERVVFGEKNSYEAMLQMMLTGEERERLQRDAKFTRALRIFVDVCWTKKQIKKRAAMILFAIVVAMQLVLLFFQALPHVARGPVQR